MVTVNVHSYVDIHNGSDPIDSEKHLPYVVTYDHTRLTRIRTREDVELLNPEK